MSHTEFDANVLNWLSKGVRRINVILCLHSRTMNGFYPSYKIMFNFDPIGICRKKHVPMGL